jgi:hypothetical protein
MKRLQNFIIMDQRLKLINESNATNMAIISNSMRALSNPDNDKTIIEYLKSAIASSKREIKLNNEMKAKWKL